MSRLGMRYPSAEKAEPWTQPFRLDRRGGLVQDWNDTVMILN